MSDIVLITISTIIEERKAARVAPAICLFRELQARLNGMPLQQLKDECNNLIKQGKIKAGNTLNDKYIILV